MKGTILLHDRLGDLCARVWFGIVPNLAVGMLLGTYFLVHCIRGIFQVEGKVVPWHSHPVAIILATQHSHHIYTITPHFAVFLDKTSKGKKVISIPARIARQTVLKPHSKHFVLVTNSASDITIVEPGIFQKTRHMTFAAHDVIDTLPSQPFNILVTNFSAKAMHLPEHVVEAYATKPTTPVMIASYTLIHQYSKRTSKSVDPTKFNDIRPAS